MIRPTFVVLLYMTASSAAVAAPPEFTKDVQPLLTKYCAGCHNADEANGEFTVHDFASLTKGGEHGTVLVPGKADESRLIKLVERTAEPAMPPDDEPAPTPAEIAVLKAWIAAGAKGPTGDGEPLSNVPRIEPTGPIRQPVHSAAWSPDGSTLAVGRFEAVELLSQDFTVKSKLEGLAGQVKAVAFLSGNRLMAAGGEPGLAGEIGVWDTSTGENLWKTRAHRDAVMSGAVTAGGERLATGSYDQTIILWDVATGEQKFVLTGHNGPVLGLAFHPTKPILASASGDRTVKLWNTTTGERLDTLTEPTKDQSAIAFSPDGRLLVAGGADSRIRIWSVDEGKAGTSEILSSHFAHEGPILGIAFSRDGKSLISAAEDNTLKVWSAATLIQAGEPASQPDWIAALAIPPSGSQVAVGRLDGSIGLISIPDVSEAVGSQVRDADPVFASQSVAPPSDSPMPEAIAEVEPNDSPATATPLSLPGIVTGALHSNDSEADDADCYRFTAKAGDAWVFETNAARSGSPADTKINILRPDGEPVERLQLRAIRDSVINFRGFTAVNPGLRVDFWEEMELNEYMYLSGEVCRIFRMPQGPDSDMQLYSVNGQRRSYHDTTPVAHALGEAVYIVEPHPPGTDLPANGLPVFSLPFENDDDSERKLGRDSKLTFTAPADGEYIVQVRETGGFGGAEYKYTLTARRPKPDFSVSIAEKERTVPIGGGQRLTLKVDRIDGFDGPVQVDLMNLPAGFEASFPVVIEAGHTEAKVTLSAAPDATTPSEESLKAIEIMATGTIAGQTVTKPVESLTKLAVGEKPKVIATLEPSGGASEIVIRPGGYVTATLRIERNGYDGEINFDVENLPHGVIVDHIGLSGVLVRTDETEREIEFHCADWVQPMQRSIFAVGKGQGDPASPPVVLKVQGRDEIARVAE